MIYEESAIKHSTAHSARGQRVATQRRPWYVRAIALCAVVFTGWHIFASFLWIFPVSPLRDVTPGNSLSSYMIPMFNQAWSVFAPEPANTDYRLQIRATVREVDGSEIETEWISAEQIEMSMNLHNLFPPRAGIQAEKIASAYIGARNGLDEQQRPLIEQNYLDEDWLSMLQSQLEVSGSGNVNAFMIHEHRAAAYATQVAKAMWGENIIRIQFQASGQRVLPFAQRNDGAEMRPTPFAVLTGWREPIVRAGQDEQAFADIFQLQYERFSGERVEH